MLKIFITVLILFNITINSSYSHVYWIAPNEFTFDFKQSPVLTSFEFSASNNFGNPEVNRIEANEVKEYTFGIIDNNDNKIDFDTIWHGKSRSIFEKNIDKEGTYLAHLERKGNAMYFSKLKDCWVKKANDQLSKEEIEKKIQSGAYYHSVKSYFSVGKRSNDWQKSAGHKIEIIPLSHPNEVEVNKKSTFMAIFNKKPLINTEVSITYQGYQPKHHDDAYIFIKTDDKGIFELKSDISGRHLIVVEHTDDIKSNKAEIENYRASLMLDIR